MIVEISMVLRGPEQMPLRPLLEKVWSEVLASNIQFEGVACWGRRLDASSVESDVLPDKEGES